MIRHSDIIKPTVKIFDKNINIKSSQFYIIKDKIYLDEIIFGHKLGFFVS